MGSAEEAFSVLVMISGFLVDEAPTSEKLGTFSRNPRLTNAPAVDDGGCEDIVDELALRPKKCLRPACAAAVDTTADVCSAKTAAESAASAMRAWENSIFRF